MKLRRLAVLHFLPVALGAVLAVARSAYAQGGGGKSADAPAARNAIIRGTVTAADGQPLPFAVVALSDLDIRQFSNAQGKFYFVNVPAGKHQLTVRQLGYVASTRAVVVAAGESMDIDLQLDRIVAKLRTMQVSAKWVCDNPGRPMPSDNAQLAQVFEQIEQNAVRLRLLAEQYPFDVVIDRMRMVTHADGLETVDLHDSVRTPSSSNARYRPGKVVIQSPEPLGRGDRMLQVPTLLDFADAVFQENHCFLLQGIQSTNGTDEIRVNFQPWSRLKTPDVSGSVFLEPATYKLLRSEIQLTKIPKELTGVAAVAATTYFDDITQGMPTVGEIIATTDLTPRSRMSPARRVERLTTLNVLFRKDSPVVPPS